MHRGEYETIQDAPTAAGRRVMWHVGTKGERPIASDASVELLTPDEPEGDHWSLPTTAAL